MKVRIVLVLAVLPGLIYPVLLGFGLTTRLALAAIFACCLGFALLSAYETVRISPGAERLWAQSIETVAFGSYGLGFALSIGILVGTDMPIASAESARISMVLDQIMGVFVYFGLIAMAAERSNRTLLRLAETDPLTGLSNRRGLQTMLSRRFPRRASAPAGGVLILDIDHFKTINDRHGHEGGDRILVAFAARMQATLRATDMIARWGGEEFLAVLPNIDANELLQVAERLRASIAEAPFALPTGPLAVTVSIGSALIGPVDGSFEEGTQQADAALYEAKARGRNRVCWAPATVSPRSATIGKNDAAYSPFRLA